MLFIAAGLMAKVVFMLFFIKDRGMHLDIMFNFMVILSFEYVSKQKKTKKCKEKIVILQPIRNHINKNLRNKGGSPAPADILLPFCAKQTLTFIFQ